MELRASDTSRTSSIELSPLPQDINLCFSAAVAGVRKEVTLPSGFRKSRHTDFESDVCLDLYRRPKVSPDAFFPALYSVRHNFQENVPCEDVGDFLPEHLSVGSEEI